MKTTVNILCYRSKTLSNGEHPLMIRICKDGKKRYQSLGISVHPDNWDFKKNKPRKNCPNKELINKIILDKGLEYQKQILELNSDNRDFSAMSLISSLTEKVGHKTVQEFYMQPIASFKGPGRQGNALVYKDSYNSIRTFTKGKMNILFNDIDVNWLNGYEDTVSLKNNTKY